MGKEVAAAVSLASTATFLQNTEPKYEQHFVTKGNP
jgi:hypothetical protein